MKPVVSVDAVDVPEAAVDVEAVAGAAAPSPGPPPHLHHLGRHLTLHDCAAMQPVHVTAALMQLFWPLWPLPRGLWHNQQRGSRHRPQSQSVEIMAVSAEESQRLRVDKHLHAKQHTRLTTSTIVQASRRPASPVHRLSHLTIVLAAWCPSRIGIEDDCSPTLAHIVSQHILDRTRAGGDAEVC